MKRRLAVTRQQFPLAPAYAMTAHAIQGMTLLLAVVNICFSALGSVVQGYIAMSRVQRRQDIIIMQSFRKEPFQQGIQIHNQIMMSHFRGQIEYRDQLVDLHVLQLANQHVCTQCLKKYHKRFFNMYEEDCIERKISITREELTCNTCMGKPLTCLTCHEKKKRYDYDPLELKKRDSQCMECEAKPRAKPKQPRSKPKQPRKKKCVSCKKDKSQDKFELDEWENGRSRSRRCLTCVASHTLTAGVKTRKRKERE